MARIACVLVPHLDLQSLERGDPELAGAPLVVCEGRDVLDLTPPARALGLRAGMTLFQARAAAPDAVFRARSPELVRAAEAALVDLGHSFSPRVEPSPGAIAVDVTELGRLFLGPRPKAGAASVASFDAEAQLGNALFLGARKLGLAVRVGIAADKTTARVAARAGDVTVVAAGREPPFLAPLPVELLEPSADTLATLRRWGVRTIGELEALPAGGVAVRLGAEGARLARVARGQAEAPLLPVAERLLFEEGIDFDWPVEHVEPLIVVLRRLVENLTARLGCRALLSGDLGLTMKLSPRGRDVRTVPVATPTRDAGALVALVRLALETAPPGNAVEGVIVRTAPAPARAAQLSFFEPPAPSPEKLFKPSAIRCQLSASDAEEARQLALHSLRPPMDAEARLDRGELRYLAGQGVGGQVLAAAGPFRVRDGWWQRPVTRDYYDVHLSDGAIYRVFHDLSRDSWHIDGCYE